MQENPNLFPLEQIEGVIERVTFHAEDSGYTVARLAVEGERDLVTIVGSMGDPTPGESVRVFGRWTSHREYGRQFQVERYDTIRPATAAAIEKYLGSGLIKGVGPVMAKRIVAMFGLETLDVIEQSPRKLLRVEGIGEKRVEMIKRAWAEQKAIREVMLFLQGHGVSATYAVKIYKTYGDDSIKVVETDPYRLAKDIWGIGFKTADKIAQNMGFAPDSEPRLRAGLLYTLSEATDYGHLYLPEPVLIEKAAEILGVEADRLPPLLAQMAGTEEVIVEEVIGSLGRGVVGNGVPQSPNDLTTQLPSAVYHPALYHTEIGLANRLRRLAKTPAPERAAEDKVSAWLDYQAGAIGIELSEEQKQAVYMALTSRFLVLTGGPGCGKTTVTNLICKAFEARRKRILLASPTGRAAKRLSEVTGRPAQTVHRLLKFDPASHGFQHNEQNPLECDVLIADEVSMLDAVMAHNLLKAVPEDAQVVFVGDADQLPSVGAGNVLGDLIASGAVPVCRLTHVFRQAAQSLIVTNAHRVNHGEWPLLISPKEREGKDCLFVEVEDGKAAADMVVTLATRSLPRLGFSPADIQVLSPMHRGESGVGHLNERLQQAWNPPHERKPEFARGSRRFRLGDRVIQLVNDYDRQVFNGDIGTITAIDHINQSLTVAFPEAEVVYDFADYDELQLAFALSIHKCISQHERVYTRDKGMVPIRNLSIGDVIVTGEGSYKRVLNKVNTGTRPVMRITTHIGFSIDVSEDHPILVSDGSTPVFVRAKEIGPQQYICLNRQIVNPSAPVILPPIRFRQNEGQTRWRNKENANICVPNYMDENLAWFLGALIGDGSYRDTRDGTIDLTNQDNVVLERWKRTLESYNLRVCEYVGPGRKAKRLYVVSKPFREWLETLGIGYSTSRNKYVPECVFRASASIKAAFLQGLFDTDGSAGTGTSRACRLTTCSPTLARHMQQLLLSIGIVSHIVSYGNGAYHVSVSGTSLPAFHRQVGFSVPHKRERLANILAHAATKMKTNDDFIPFGAAVVAQFKDQVRDHFQKSQGVQGRGISANRSYKIGSIVYPILRGEKSLTYHHAENLAGYLTEHRIAMPESLSWLLMTRYFYDRVRSVEYIGRDDVMYDIEVEDIHSFVSNGFVCHNSQGSEYPAVLLVLGSAHYMMLQRNLLYTALTRARRLCVLVGEKRAIWRAVKNDKTARRFTRLAERLQE
jgi:exodeoxyribonuclease V alpha subunit